MQTIDDNSDDKQVEHSIFENPYEREVLLDNWKSDSGKTMKAIFIIGGIILISDLLALFAADSINNTNLIVCINRSVSLCWCGIPGQNKTFTGNYNCSYFIWKSYCTQYLCFRRSRGYI